MDLPSPLDRILPEVLALLPDREPLATCTSCAMAQPASPGRPTFSAAARCCTYQPKLANFLVGQVLRAGGAGATQVRKRLEDPSGVYPLGVEPDDAWAARWAASKPGDFGNDEAATCPYWVPGPFGCSIHAHREAVCRTWSCRMGRGRHAYDTWMAARDLIRSTERLVAESVKGELGDDLEAYFIGCATRADALEPTSFRGPRTDALLALFAEQTTRRDQPLPDTPIPYVSKWTVYDDRIELESWSAYDPVFVPPWIFALLSKLDGKTHWAQALQATAAELDRPISPDFVQHLWSRGLLADPEEAEARPARISVIPLS